MISSVQKWLILWIFFHTVKLTIQHFTIIQIAEKMFHCFAAKYEPPDRKLLAIYQISLHLKPFLNEVFRKG